MSTSLRCAHISDLHFGYCSLNPMQFLSKRWLGNFNLWFYRKRQYVTDHLDTLIHLFKQQGVSHVFITGDLTCTSLTQEFQMAKMFVSRLEEHFHVFIVPGNHDKYTRQADRKQTFYSFFPEKFDKDSPWSLRTDRIAATRLSHRWWVIGLDTTLASPLWSARGEFSKQHENHLRKLIENIPADHSILLMNHYPFFQHTPYRTLLHRGEALQSLLTPNVRLYLHGHIHRHCVADLRASHLPIILDSGSITHAENSSWNLLELTEDQCSIQPFHWQGAQWIGGPVTPYAWGPAYER